MTSEMVERIAKAIYEGRNGRGCTPWGRLAGSHKAPYLSDAIAALKAMRESTKGMIEDGGEHAFTGNSAVIFRSMIDHEIAAAEEGP